MAHQLSNPRLELFGPGLLQQVARRNLRPARLQAPAVTIAIVALTWLPLAVLSAIDGTLFRSDIPFARDFAVHVRLLIELPTMFVAAALARPLVQRSIAYLAETDLVPVDKRPAFGALVASTKRAADSPVVAVLLCALAVAASWLEMSSWIEAVVGSSETSWRTRDGAITNAGIWFALVARPILYAQFALWLYRFALWSRILVRLSFIVRPIAAHPDGRGGLAPLNAGHASFAVIAFVIGADLAAGMANRALHLHADVTDYRALVAIIVLVTTLLLSAPMLAFAPRLYRAQVEATFAFGNAASAAGRGIDDRIVRADQQPLHDLGEAFTYYLHITEGMQRLRRLAIVPLHRRTILVFALAVGAPFLVASLTEFSLGELLRRVHGLMELNPVKK